MKKTKVFGVGCVFFIVMAFFVLYLWTAMGTITSYAKSNSVSEESVYSVEATQTYVQFNEQGVAPIFVEYGATNVQFPVPESGGGKEFQGWYYNGIRYADAEGKQVKAWDIQEEEVTLSAQWTVEKYTIKITYNGKTYYYSVQNGWATNASYRVEYGAQLRGFDQLEEDFRKLEIIENKCLARFTRNGNDFGLDSASIPDLGANGEVVELVPCFEDETHRVYYDLNGGEGPEDFVGTQDFVSGEIIEKALPRLQNDLEGHQFFGWKIEECPDNPALVGELIGSIMPDCTKAQGNGHVRLKAAWRYKITYNLDKGQNASGNPTSYTFEDEIILKSPTKANYDFKGWFLDSQFTQQCTEIKDMEEDIVLYAKWEGKWFSINCYNVKFKSETAYRCPSQYQHGVLFTLPRISFQTPYPDRQAHCEFISWCSDAALTHEITSISASRTGTVNIYARWRYVSPGGSRYSDYTITDSGRFNQRYDTVTIGMTWELPGYNALKAMGFKYLVLQIELTAWEVNDGYQYIFIYDGESKDAKLLADKKFEISSSSAKVLPVFTFIIDIEQLKNVDVLYVRYGASGNGSDTWHTNLFKYTTQYVVLQEDKKTMINGSITY